MATAMSDSSGTHTTELRVRYAETDQMGVVYHANYLVWCEVGRTELLRSLGTSYAELERQGVLLVVADASLRFHSPARYDDRIKVETAVCEVRSRSISFDYRMCRVMDGGETERLVTARTKLIVLGAQGRPRTLPPFVLNLFGDARSHSHV